MVFGDTSETDLFINFCPSMKSFDESNVDNKWLWGYKNLILLVLCEIVL